MKKLFGSLLAILLLWSIGTYMSLPEHASDKPVIYWVTDPNPARVLQVQRFHEWLEENGYPEMELRLDTSNSDMSKKVIQGVSGVGSDIMDISTSHIDFFVRMGIVQPVTEQARAMGFSIDETYPALTSILTVNGEQYAFPCNVSVAALIANVDNFRSLGMEPPPETWSFDEFEAMGKEYVKLANAGLGRQINFFSQPPSRLSLMRSIGGDNFNETLTASNLDSPEYIRTLDLLRKWTYEDRILPSSADLASLATDAGYGGQSLQLLNSGNYGMIYIGRHAIIQLREFGAMELRVSQSPNGGFPNEVINTRMAGLYTGSPHPELAVYFLKFLASDAYNELIVLDGDGLPPHPVAAKKEHYLRPSKFKNEHLFHEPFSRYARETAIPASASPFVIPQTADRIEREGYEGFMANIYTSEQTARIVSSRVNAEIQRTLQEQPSLRPQYDLLVERQQEIDRRKAAGERIPAEWILNPFYLAYYQATGQLEHHTDA